MGKPSLRKTHCRSWEEANEILGSRDSRLIGNNTWLVRLGNNFIGLRLHATYVLIYSPMGYIRYATGMWRTKTTMDRLNRFGHPEVRVRQRAFDWYMFTPDQQWRFMEGLTVDQNGRLVA